MSLVRIATVDTAHAEELVEALAAAGIEAQTAEVVPMTQVEYVRHSHRPMTDVFVPAEREADARAIADKFVAEAEAAAEAEAEKPPAPDGAAPEAAAPERAQGSVWIAALVALVGLALASGVIFGFDRVLHIANERYPTAFTIIALALFAALYLALRRRD